MRQRRPFVLARKDKASGAWIYVSNSVGKDGASPELTASQENALKFETEDEASEKRKTIGLGAKGFSARKI